MMTFLATCTSWWIFFLFFLLILTKKVPLFVITHSTTLKTCLLLSAFIKLRQIKLFISLFFLFFSTITVVCGLLSLLGAQDVPSFFPQSKSQQITFAVII